MRPLGKMITTLILTAGSIVGFSAGASAAHYQGGEYSYCSFPTNAAYDGVYVSAYGVGSDAPHYNQLVAAKAFVGVEKTHTCYRRGAVYHVVRVQIDRVALRIDNVSRSPVGPVNYGKNYAIAQSGGVAVPCGKVVQAGVRYSVRYSNGALLQSYLNSAGFIRCSR